MRIALVTANNVYYTNGFQVFFIPMHLAENKPKDIIDALKIIRRRYKIRNSTNQISKEDYWIKKLKMTLTNFVRQWDY